ncbi:hypothetical protein CWATWH8502_4684 [Crocosphaera watsonii WH 8502]|uniref:Uncharacterized protein n=1 Tax=Crocosphaera watsonii WH 8502 TaxID=423474 RepID=T2IDG4_CROWT|nr:hypothetical protein CWATWH8502_4684 [Crocosphaera watsonii WH 8502]
MTQNLPSVTRLGILEAEAGNRTQSDTDCWWHWRYRSPHDEKEPRKVTYARAGKAEGVVSPDPIGVM